MRKVIPLLLFIANILSAETINKITFSGGAPLDTYQPRMAIAVLKEAFKRNGIQFHAIYRPSLRSLEMSNSGISDGELHRIYDFHKVSQGKYPNLIRIESQILSVYRAVFSNKNINIESWKDLKGHKVAYYRGRKDIQKILNNVLAPQNIIKTITDEQAFNMLLAKRVDIVISESIEGKKLLEKKEIFSNIREIKKIDETKIYAYIHKKYKKIMPKIVISIEEMKKDGSFAKILNKSLK